MRSSDHKSLHDKVSVILSYAMSVLTKFEMWPNEAAPSGASAGGGPKGFSATVIKERCSSDCGR